MTFGDPYAEVRKQILEGDYPSTQFQQDGDPFHGIWESVVADKNQRTIQGLLDRFDGAGSDSSKSSVPALTNDSGISSDQSETDSVFDWCIRLPLRGGGYNHINVS